VHDSIEAHKEQDLFVLISILCLLSHDQVFNSSIQKMTMRTPTWYQDRVTRTISLGGLVILLLLKSIHANIQHFHDISLHVACIACMMNMTPSIIEMEATVCQKFMVLLDQSTKRLLKSELMEWQHIHSDVIAMILEVCNSIITYSLKSNANLVYSLLQHTSLQELSAYQRFHALVTNLRTVICFYLGDGLFPIQD
jgi:hypothetical protein